MISHGERVRVVDEAKRLGMSCDGVQFWWMIAADISHLLLHVNSTINFFIYCYFSKQFQKALRTKLIEFATFCHCYCIERIANIIAAEEIQNRRTSFPTEHTPLRQVRSEMIRPDMKGRNSSVATEHTPLRQVRSEVIKEADNN